MIKKEGSKYTLYSKDGSKRLSRPGSLKSAQKREREVEYFKHLKKCLNKAFPNTTHLHTKHLNTK